MPKFQCQAIALSVLFVAAGTSAANHSSVVDAPVVDVVPIVEVYTQRIPHQTCRDERVRVVERGARRSATPTLVGAVLGGTVASVIGRNSSRRDVISGAGAILGASMGYDRSRGHRRDSSYYVTEEVCSTEYELREQERTSAYQVRYRYAGRVYETRTDYAPGETIAVRVKLEPLP